MEKLWYHHEGDNAYSRVFKGKRVLYGIIPIKEDGQQKALLVAGYVVGEYAQIAVLGKKPVTAVNPITDKQERRELSDFLLEEEGAATISFWDQEESKQKNY